MTQPMTRPAFAAGQTYRSKKLRDYRVTLVRPGGDVREPAWFVEPAGSSAHGCYVEPERILGDPELFSIINFGGVPQGESDHAEARP